MDNPKSVCAAVLGLLEEAFDAAPMKMGQAFVATGGAIVDGCCDGLLMVAPEIAIRTADNTFPLQIIDDDDCLAPMIALTVLVVANRCLVPVDQKGRAPRRAVQQSVYDTVFADAKIVWQVLAGAALLGEDSIGDPLWRRSGLSQLWTSDVGGCLGSETRVTLGIPGGQWCD